METIHLQIFKNNNANCSNKAVSKLMGHAEEIITIDVYEYNQKIITDCIDEIAKYVVDATPDTQKENLLDIVVEISDYITSTNCKGARYNLLPF